MDALLLSKARPASNVIEDHVRQGWRGCRGKSIIEVLRPRAQCPILEVLLEIGRILRQGGSAQAQGGVQDQSSHPGKPRLPVAWLESIVALP